MFCGKEVLISSECLRYVGRLDIFVHTRTHTHTYTDTQNIFARIRTHTLGLT